MFLKMCLNANAPLISGFVLVICIIVPTEVTHLQKVLCPLLFERQKNANKENMEIKHHQSQVATLESEGKRSDRWCPQSRDRGKFSLTSTGRKHNQEAKGNQDADSCLQ